MAIDSSIYQNVGRGVKSVADYDAEAAQIKQNKLAELLNGMKMEESRMTLDDSRKKRDDVNRLNQYTAESINPDGTIDRNKLFKAVAGGGMGSQIPGLQKSFAESDKAVGEVAKNKAETEKTILANNHAKLVLGEQLLRSAKDQPSYEKARAEAQAYGLDVSRMPAQYDPAFVEEKRQASLDAKTQLEQIWKQKEYDLNIEKFGEDKRRNKATEGLTAAGQQVTVRGQDMTDDRAREFNSAKIEQNNIRKNDKQEEKDKAKTNQIATFDTMLGTLDRLENHPGLKRSVGVIGAFPTMPGSDSANFKAELNTFLAQTFVPMVAQLKGMGALSDAEGKKISASVGALDPSMGEEAFRQSVALIKQDMNAARERMAGAPRNATPATPANPAAPAAVKDKAAFDQLPSGALFIAPDGTTRRKP